ncbi:uncharacterized protein LOC132674237 isoform X2 [Panthera onca]
MTKSERYSRQRLWGQRETPPRGLRSRPSPSNPTTGKPNRARWWRRRARSPDVLTRACPLPAQRVLGLAAPATPPVGGGCGEEWVLPGDFLQASALNNKRPSPMLCQNPSREAKKSERDLAVEVGDLKTVLYEFRSLRSPARFWQIWCLRETEHESGRVRDRGRHRI